MAGTQMHGFKAKPKSRWFPEESAGREGTADWESVDGTVLKELVARISSRGGAIRLGYTRDGNSYAVGVYGDGDPYTLYCAGSADVTEWCKRMAAKLTEMDKHG